LKPSSHACRSCGRAVSEGDSFFPFCSERCRLVDLGSWLDERYRVSRDLSRNDREEEVTGGEAADDVSSEEDLDD
jgi:hypothetical protein